MKITDIVNCTYKAVLFIDFESRSKADLLNVGAHRYCVDPSTRVLLTTYAVGGGPIQLCEFDNLDKTLIGLLQDPMVLKVAHNSEFDMSLLKYTLGIDVRIEEWFDTAFQAAYYAHPRKLSNLALRLNLTEKGEQDGILLFSLPRKARKGETLTSDFNEAEDFPKEWEDFKTYAKQDIGTLREAFSAMQMLPEIEVFVSHMTMEMNFNGVPFDAKLGAQIWNKAIGYEHRAGAIALEKYGIENLKSTQQVQKALMRAGVELPSLNKKERGGEEHEILELRDVATGAAFSKIPKALERRCPDGRLHGEFVGYGAHTGRWSSRGVQLQNWARILGDVSETLDPIESYDHLRQHMRLCLGHVPHMAFTFADLAQIEARIVAWLAWSTWRMEAFASGVDIYARSAEKMFAVKNVTKDNIYRQYGKAAELGFGYGGGHVAILNIQPEFYASVGEAKVREMVQLWRSANPEVAKLWRTLENTMKMSMKTGSEQLICGRAKLKFQYDGKSGKIVLPSGRSLYYRGLHSTATSNGFELAYMDYSAGGMPRRVHLWGGVILENITQAIARDVLVDVMKRTKERIPEAECIATVHDEVWYLHKPDVPMLEVLLEEMARPITWAKDLVTKGDGTTSDRYRK